MTMPHTANVVNSSGLNDVVPSSQHQEITQEGMEPLFVKFFPQHSQTGSISLVQNGDMNNNPSQDNNNAFISAN